MINYRRLFRNKKIRARLLAMADWIPDKLMIAIQYYMVTGRRVNFKNPERYTDKIQAYKLTYRDPLLTTCADKYAVRDFVKSRGCESLLNCLYGVYQSASQIDLDSLPDSFVIKTTNGSGTNLFCENKNEFDIPKARRTLDQWMRQKKSPHANREWAYYNIENKIIVEQYLKEPAGSSLTDYKFFCFNGEPSHLCVVSDRFTQERLDLYDINWHRMNVKQNDCERDSGCELPKPEHFEEMVEYARVLSKGFPHVRVDLYNVSGAIFFGEMTFYSYSGYYVFTPDSFDYELGEKFKLHMIQKPRS